MSKKSIFGNETYMDFEFKFNTFPVYFALVPMSYIIPTLFIVIYTVFVFMEHYLRRKECIVNSQIFLVVTMAHIVNLLSFFFDYMSNRFPATGMMTSWCASNYHPTLLIFILASHFYLDYLAMGFPFFMSVLRLIFMIYPNTHKQLSNSPFLLANIAFWMGSTISINLMVIFLVAQARNRGSHHVQYKSRKSRRAELSVTLTTFAMIVSFLMRGICLIVYLTVPSVASWLAIIRPLGSDAEVVVSPWVFYLTHPAFRRKKRQSTITVGYSISLGSGGARK
uniref:Serpentine Receptor, class T n=1 Tax=Caenorhabditis tropicalis TaxID=1561998 RepID=A0A1I7UYE3_9PELO